MAKDTPRKPINPTPPGTPPLEMAKAIAKSWEKDSHATNAQRAIDCILKHLSAGDDAKE